MHGVDTHIDIYAPASRVWAILTDFPRYPEWNPFILSVEGHANTGAKIKIRVQPPGQKAMTFRPKILSADPERELRWLGHVGFPGLFDGEHVFRLDNAEPGLVRFEHREQFTGILRPLVLSASFLEAARQGFEAMNMALKFRAEASK